MRYACKLTCIHTFIHRWRYRNTSAHTFTYKPTITLDIFVTKFQKLNRFSIKYVQFYFLRYYIVIINDNYVYYLMARNFRECAFFVNAPEAGLWPVVSSSPDYSRMQLLYCACVRRLVCYGVNQIPWSIRTWLQINSVAKHSWLS